MISQANDEADRCIAMRRLARDFAHRIAAKIIDKINRFRPGLLKDEFEFARLIGGIDGDKCDAGKTEASSISTHSGMLLA